MELVGVIVTSPVDHMISFKPLYHIELQVVTEAKYRYDWSNEKAITCKFLPQTTVVTIIGKNHSKHILPLPTPV